MSRVNTEGVKLRKTAVQPAAAAATAPASVGDASDANVPVTSSHDHVTTDDHPAGPVKHGQAMQALRIFLFTLYFLVSLLFIHGAQLLGMPLYFYNRDYFYAWMAVCKQYFGLLLTTGTWLWSPTVIRISGDASVEGQLMQRPDGRLVCDFPERLVLMANHQIYTDWLYLWWISYTAGLHGHIYIILKESLKYIPAIGPGMVLFNFIFMSRKWEKDEPRLKHRLQKLNTRHSGPMTGSTGPRQLDPAWLLIFPEGTNLSPNTRMLSQRWSQKSGTPDVKHMLLPRSTGLQFCLNELKDTVDWIYDCTIAYEGVPHGQYGGSIFSIRSVYFEGRPPKSVNMHWRRFRVADIPLHNKHATEEWLLQRWREKDDLIEYYHNNGRFPADPAAVAKEDGSAFIQTEVRPNSPFETVQMFTPVLGAYMICKILIKVVNLATTGKMSDD